MQNRTLIRGFIRLLLLLPAFFGICLSTVYAAPGDNIALSSAGSTAAMSSLWTPSWPASNCINGVTASNSNSALCHTGRRPTSYEWFDISLPEKKSIEQVVIYNRTNCCSNRIRNVFLLVSETPFPTATTAAGLAAARAQAMLEYQIPVSPAVITVPVNDIEGRYVRLQKSGVGNVTRNINLLEVQVIEGELETYSISGHVINDKNVNGSRDVSDSGIPDVTVTLRNETTGVCETARSFGDGLYEFTGLVADDYTIYESQAETTPLPVECPPVERDPSNFISVTDNSLPVTLVDSDLSENDFFDVREPTLESAGVVVANQGSTTVIPHLFTAYSDGTVTFSISDQLPVDDDWTVTPYVDNNCDGQLDSADSLLLSPVSLTALQQICLLQKAFVGSNLSTSTQLSFTVRASYIHADPANLLHGLASNRSLTNRLTLTGAIDEALQLNKRVQNSSLAGEAVLFNTAHPGEVLSYTIQFANSGASDIFDLTIHDHIPANSSLSTPVTCPVTLPAGLTGCTIVAPSAADNSAGYTGFIEWRFGGVLVAGASGTVTIDVEVD